MKNALVVLTAAFAASASAQQPIDASKGAGSVSAFTPLVTAPPATAAFLSNASDNFDRPDAPTLGQAWTDQVAGLGILSNRGYSVGTLSSWALHSSASSNYQTASASLDFHYSANGPGVYFVALIVGAGAGLDNIFAKVQDNTQAGDYNRVYFYRGNNGSPWTSPSSFLMANPTTSGRMTLYITNNGDTANLDIDNNFDGVVDEHFEASGILAAGMTLGTSAGISCFRQPQFDNWTFSDGTPSTPIVYCTSGTTSSGCNASISASGNPDVAHTAPCQISVANVEGQRTGILFYGLQALPQPWCVAGGGSSYLCVKAPTTRTGTQSSGGTAVQCNGAFGLDWNAFQLANPGALGAPWVAGSMAFVQAWFRDPPACKTTSMSDAVELTYQP